MLVENVLLYRGGVCLFPNRQAQGEQGLRLPPGAKAEWSGGSRVETAGPPPLPHPPHPPHSPAKRLRTGERSEGGSPLALLA